MDASAAISFVLPDEKHYQRAQRLVAAWAQKDFRLCAPPLFESEADSVIRRRVHIGTMTPRASAAAFTVLDALQVEIFQDEAVRLRARQLAEQFNTIRCYDTTYAAFAEGRGLELWTADERFFNTVKGTLNFVFYVGNYSNSNDTEETQD
jgi:predicted nucleic acid-binding protein